MECQKGVEHCSCKLRTVGDASKTLLKSSRRSAGVISLPTTTARWWFLPFFFANFSPLKNLGMISVITLRSFRMMVVSSIFFFLMGLYGGAFFGQKIMVWMGDFCWKKGEEIGGTIIFFWIKKGTQKTSFTHIAKAWSNHGVLFLGICTLRWGFGRMLLVVWRWFHKVTFYIQIAPTHSTNIWLIYVGCIRASFFMRWFGEITHVCFVFVVGLR